MKPFSDFLKKLPAARRARIDEAAFRSRRFVDHGQSVQGNNDLLVLTQPAIITEIHAGYLEAGADIISTNTFNAQRISLADYAMEGLAAEINLAAAQRAGLTLSSELLKVALAIRRAP